MKQYLLVLCLLVTNAFAAQYKYEEPNSEALLIELKQAKTDAEKLPLLIKLFTSYEVSNHEKLNHYADEAITLAKKLNNDQALAAAFSAKARSYSYAGEFDTAIDNYMLALKNAKISNEEYLLYNIHGSLGNTYYQLYQNAKAKEHYEYAHKLLESSNLEQKERKLGAILLNLGNIHLEQAEYDSAETNYAKALDLFKAIEYDIGIADALLNTAVLHSNRDSNWALALPLLKEAMIVHEKIEHPRNKIHILNSLADYHLYKQQYDEAIAYTDQMITLSKTIDAKHLIVLGEQTLAVIYEQQKDYEKALAAKESSETLKDSIFSETTLAKIVDIETQLKTREKEQQISRLGVELGKRTTRQKFTALLSLIAVVISSLVIWLVYQQKRNLNKRFISIHEENEILKLSNLSLKDRLLKLADSIEHAKSSQAGLKNKKYHSSSFKKEDMQEHMNSLLDIMEKKKLFLQADLKLNELAGMISMNPHQLSEFLNETIGKNFNEFINTYRVDEAKAIMHKPDAHNKKLLTIAHEAGFNSKASFNRAFKTVTGTSPSTFKKHSDSNNATP